jgi:hypothetical protein
MWSSWASLAQEGRTMPGAASGTTRDRTLISLLEFVVAFTLMISPAMPWFVVHHTMGVPDSELVWLEYGTSYVDALEFLAMWLIPLGTLLALGAAVLGIMLPGRGEITAVACLFAIAGVGGLAQAGEVFVLGHFDDFVLTPGVAYGLVVYLAAAAGGVALAAIDLRLGGNSTMVWQALGRPPTKRLGLAIGYAAVLAVALLIGLYPTFPRWFLIGFAILVAAPLAMRARMVVRPAS